MAGQSAYESAVEWIGMGIAPIPIFYRDKKSKIKWKDYQDTLPCIGELKQWFTSRFCNLAIITGHRNLVVIDFDDLATWQLWQSWIDIKMPELLRQTYRVKTSRGQHIYLFVEDAPDRTLKIKTDDNRTLIDVKAAGGYVLTAPSIHPTGHVYQAINRPSDIMTVSCLKDVLPSMLLERALSDVEIPEATNGVNGHIDPFKAVPTSIQGDPISWIKRNRNILEFFPNAVPSGGNRWLKVICPLHEDHNESGWIDLQRQRFGCHAGCAGRGVDIVDFLCLLKGIDRKGAISELAR